MKSRKPVGSFAPQEVQQFILPITISAILLVTGLIVADLSNGTPFNTRLVVYGLIVIFGTIINHVVIVHTADFRQSYG